MGGGGENTYNLEINQAKCTYCFTRNENCDPHLILVDHIDFWGFSTAIIEIFVNDTYNVPVHLIYSLTQTTQPKPTLIPPQ